MTQTRKTALLAGATGVVGRNLLRQLVSDPDWDVIAVSRRAPDIEGDYRHIVADLLDPRDARTKLGGLRDVTHVFFAAYIEKPSWAEMVAPNMALLTNLMDAVEPAAKDCSTSISCTAPSGTAAISACSRHRPRRPIRATCRPTSTMTSRPSSWDGRKARRGRGPLLGRTVSAVSPLATR